MTFAQTAMSPTTQRLSRLAKTEVPRWLLLLGALIPITAAAAGTARSIRAAADERYVLSDSLLRYQQAEALKHQKDSLVTDARFDKLAAPVEALYRACQRKGECP